MKDISTVMDVGKAAKLARKAANLTQTELALVAGVGHRFIVDLEKGKETVQFGLVLKVLSVLGITLRHDGGVEQVSKP